MILLIINELYQYGGAEMQTQREAKIFREKGHEVYIMTLDPNCENGWISKEHINIARNDNKYCEQYQRLFADKEITKKLCNIINQINPDYIHINNAYDHYFSIFEVVKGYKSFQTIRDYSAVCPNGLSIHNDLSLCGGYTSCNECFKKCVVKKDNKIKAMWQLICFLRKKSVRKTNVKKFVCPSQMLTDYCNRQGIKTKCINNPFDFSMTSKINTSKNIDFEQKIFLYYGQLVEHKGVGQLIKAFSIFAKDKENVELQLVGRMPDEYKPILDELINHYGNGKIKYIGTLKYEDMIKKLLTVHTVVIPSLWMENYPNTALEAAVLQCLVLASDRGGMREIVQDDRFIFDVLNQNSIIEKLYLAYDISFDEYRKITERNMLRVRDNNTMEKYYDRLIYCLEN